MSLRVLIAVTHLLGAGHLTRAAAIGRELARAGSRVTLVSGGAPAPLIRTDGIDLVQLPPVRARADDLRTLRGPDGEPAGADHLLARRTLLLETLARTRPDIVVTELFPFGRRALADEFTALVDAASLIRPRPRIVCSVRDILVAPDKPAKVARTHAILAHHYDAVLVHADPTLVGLDASWPVDDALAARLVYTGYVDAEADPAGSPEASENRIVVSGGSSEAGLLVYRAALAAAALMPEHRWLILLGGGIGGQDAAAIRAEAGPNVSVEPARPDFRALLAGSALFVGQCGYNTCLDVLASEVRAVFVPFERGSETEQRLRAERLAAAGLASLLPEAELTGPALAGEIRDALARPKPPSSRIDRGGLRRTAEILAGLGASPSPPATILA